MPSFGRRAKASSRRTVEGMDLVFLGSLAVLALIDSTSFGTLLIPVWLLLHPGKVSVARMFIFLGTVAAFYFAVGLGLTQGLQAFLPHITAFLETREASWVQLVIGVALFFLSFRLDGKRKRKPEGVGRLARWRERALGNDGGAPALVGLALTATLLEVGTMLPYLAAVGLITTEELPVPQRIAVLAGYCVVMILPALVLMGLRLAAGHRIEGLLRRISDWMTGSDMIGWIVGIVGFLLASDAAQRLGLLSFG
jgi:hypothetical protein